MPLISAAALAQELSAETPVFLSTSQSECWDYGLTALASHTGVGIELGSSGLPSKDLYLLS